MATVWTPRQKFSVLAPRNHAERMQLCGFNPGESERYWDSAAAADNHPTFFIAGATREREDTVRGWEIWREITGMDPDTTPQPTGNCVAASSDDVVQLAMCVDIKAGDREQWKDTYSTYHYAYGRVVIGKNRLRGEPGSIGGWQAAAHQQGGILEMLPNLPAYNKQNVDDWGNDKKVNSQSFRDYIEQANDFLIGDTARINTMSELFDAISNHHFCTIASTCGYTMLADKSGYHRPSGSWGHQMSIWGYSISKNWIAIKNQWGRAAHGKLVDFETGEPWPPGFLRVRLDDFEKRHLRGSETIAYSRFSGFPEQRFDHSVLG